ncbi:hypothetical protein [Pelotomaculum sp. PtaB.Bin117]|uniref:hypothetical protein n=1 Tax=Pelotomaculum sp. PtaB.Bin117 TaxID=1811694 RepID=UPI00257C614D|nr:hypothetical protein [Pelotomaculum sp. PtaB.Bin117]
MNSLYRLLPLLFMLAVSPESEKKLDTLNSFIMATKDTVSSIKSGIDTFHAAMMPFMTGSATNETSSPPPAQPKYDAPGQKEAGDFEV